MVYELDAGTYRLRLGPAASSTVKVALHVPGVTHGHDELPDEFAELENPFAGDLDVASAAGKLIYEQHCTTCHGTLGKGDGAGGVGLAPAPADLTQAEHGTALNYLLWRVTTGGASADLEAGVTSSMPAYGETLSADDRWRVVIYVAEELVPEGTGHDGTDADDATDGHEGEDHD